MLVCFYFTVTIYNLVKSPDKCFSTKSPLISSLKTLSYHYGALSLFYHYGALFSLAWVVLLSVSSHFVWLLISCSKAVALFWKWIIYSPSFLHKRQCSFKMQWGRHHCLGSIKCCFIQVVCRNMWILYCFIHHCHMLSSFIMHPKSTIPFESCLDIYMYHSCSFLFYNWISW